MWVIALAALASAQTSFVTFESGPVRRLALTPDGSRLLAVNTPDARLEVFDLASGRSTLVHAASIPVGLEPVAVAARSNDEIWVVNHLSDRGSLPGRPRRLRPGHAGRHRDRECGSRRR